MPTDKVGFTPVTAHALIANVIQTDLTPGVPNIYTSRPKSKIPREALDAAGNLVSGHIEPTIPRRQTSMRPHNNTRRSTRQNSFHPQLESIFSEENSPTDNEDSLKDSTPSLTGSLGSSEDSVRIQMARTRESCDDRFSGYLLALAAKAAEKQLQEQTLAAFPNESLHEIVEHFYDREIDAGSDDGTVEGIGMLIDGPEMPAAVRRKSTEVGWATKEMQQHQEELNRLREEETNKKIAAEATEPTFADPFWTNGMTAKPFAGRAASQAETQALRSAASPPMLGSDLTFRMCPSPKATKFESDQPIDVQPNRHPDGGGLWGGYCVAEESGEYLSPSIKGPMLIQTPLTEREDPFSSAFSNSMDGVAKSSPAKREDSGLRMLAGIDETLKAEVAKSKAQEVLLAEFDDSFVTQVYNYLSLGYPTLARPYDAELARISRIPEAELRVDDAKTDAKGYIGIGTGAGKTGHAVGADYGGYCARWKALRVYILEWALQHPSMSNGVTSPSAWGVLARRGSWAI